jgi:uncharacterized protein (DUF1330 family)
MPACVVAWVTVADPSRIPRYAAAAPAVIERHGGRYLFSGAGAQRLEGDWGANGMAVIEFPSHEPAPAWYDSPEYSPLRALRQTAGPTALLITPDTTPAG